MMHQTKNKYPAIYPNHTRHRLVAAAIFICSSSLIIVAILLDPNPSGSCTHLQLGLPPCGFKAATGLPCATCGMTTAFSFAVHGQLVNAAFAQPAGTLLAIANVMLVLISGYTLIHNISLMPLWRLICHQRTIATIVVLILASWAYTLTVTILGLSP